MKIKNNKLVRPMKMYNSIVKDKYKIYLDNDNKSGIYRWTNNKNNKRYIGSAKCLKGRLNIYFSPHSMEKSLKKGNSIIYRALLKHGYNNFKLEILEYCEQDLLINREQYYLDLLKPEYNLCKTAGSNLGKRHSESTKEKIGNSIRGNKNPLFGKHHTVETRINISKATLNKVHIMPKMRLETKLKLSLRSIGMKVKVYNSSNIFTMEFPTINSTAKHFNVTSSTIKRALKLGISYQNFFFKSEIIDNRIWVYDYAYKLIKVLDNRSETSKVFDIPTTTLSRYI